jgi:hypothetical protein
MARLTSPDGNSVPDRLRRLAEVVRHEATLLPERDGTLLDLAALRLEVAEAAEGSPPPIEPAGAWQHPESGDVINHPPTEDGWVPLYREAT